MRKRRSVARDFKFHFFSEDAHQPGERYCKAGGSDESGSGDGAFWWSAARGEGRGAGGSLENQAKGGHRSPVRTGESAGLPMGAWGFLKGVLLWFGGNCQRRRW